MQKLPDFLVLDFCEWIKHTTLSKSKYSGIDLRDAAGSGTVNKV